MDAVLKVTVNLLHMEVLLVAAMGRKSSVELPLVAVLWIWSSNLKVTVKLQMLAVTRGIFKTAAYGVKYILPPSPSSIGPYIVTILPQPNQQPKTT